RTRGLTLSAPARADGGLIAAVLPVLGHSSLAHPGKAPPTMARTRGPHGGQQCIGATPLFLQSPPGDWAVHGRYRSRGGCSSGRGRGAPVRSKPGRATL